ncbi:MAG TPA: CDP-alcohol phosphatidyltransferase family protein [Flavobacteriales bacterium]|nr:CDP-alcohol phosphatidyltransferase family protein [Flavobacteriales bacterium]
MKMQKIVAFIPNLFTLGNLFCGCLGIIYAFNNRLDAAFYMVLLAAFLDFFDGFFARLLNVSGELGKQLDSLADAVSFGVLPAIVMFLFLNFMIDINGITCEADNSFWSKGELLEQAKPATNCLFSFDPVNYHPLSFVALLIALFSIYRLAKFNIDTRQSHGFIGLPTPANALFFCSYVFLFFYSIDETQLNLYFHPPLEGWTIYPPLSAIPGPMDYLYSSTIFHNSDLLKLIYHPILILSLCIIFSLLLVSPIPLFALKFKNFGWNDNKIRYIFLVLAIGLLIVFQLVAIPFIVILYILISIINNIFKITV